LELAGLDVAPTSPGTDGQLKQGYFIRTLNLLLEHQGFSAFMRNKHQKFRDEIGNLNEMRNRASHPEKPLPTKASLQRADAVMALMTDALSGVSPHS
jgi:hypothetical protein